MLTCNEKGTDILKAEKQKFMESKKKKAYDILEPYSRFFFSILPQIWCVYTKLTNIALWYIYIVVWPLSKTLVLLGVI